MAVNPSVHLSVDEARNDARGDDIQKLGPSGMSVRTILINQRMKRQDIEEMGGLDSRIHPARVQEAHRHGYTFAIHPWSGQRVLSFALCCRGISHWEILPVGEDAFASSTLGDTPWRVGLC